MKFIFADSLDMIDPTFDFEADRVGPHRELYWGDVYPHEFFKAPPYDGVLISRGVVGDDRFPGKYPEDLMMRFRRVGARSFLRLHGPALSKLSIFGDCGAFSYVTMEAPPYTSDMMLEFYADGGFTHGCSVDHIVFDFEPNAKGLRGGSKRARHRVQLTLENARQFIKAARSMGRRFTPLGVIQGWSPPSMADAARNLERMGYRYLAVGGMVRLKASQIHLCLQAIRAQISRRVKLHLLGFAKAEEIHEFSHYGIASFDTTSPLTRAFKDSKANYYSPNGNGGLEYFTAIRIPHATENLRLKRRARSSGSNQEWLTGLEQRAMHDLHLFDRGRASLPRTLRSVLAYSREFSQASGPARRDDAALQETELSIRRTLSRRPWTHCRCRVCREAGIHTLIFRGSNRNKRRGFHNLAVYHQHLKRSTS